MSKAAMHTVPTIKPSGLPTHQQVWGLRKRLLHLHNHQHKRVFMNRCDVFNLNKLSLLLYAGENSAVNYNSLLV